MGKILSVVGGLIAIALGVVGVIGWWNDLVICFRGFFPAFLILAGLIAAFAGISEIKDEAARKKEEAKRKEEEAKKTEK